MIRLTCLDGRVFELDEKTLEKFQIPDAEVGKLAAMPALPARKSQVAENAKDSGPQETEQE